MNVTSTNEPISSRPRYATLQSRPCAAALIICDSQGADAVLALAETAPDLLPKANILHLADADSRAEALGALDAASLTQVGSTAELPAALDRALQGARMGLHAYLAGSEGLIAMAQAHLLACGLTRGAIQSEHRGTAARRMVCVHCKTVAEDVTLDPYICPGCGRSLFVRDHFSPRLGAFQGVCIDAETPGDIPEAVEIRL